MSVRLAHNLKLLAQHTAGGAPNLGEGMAMKIKDGRRYMYIAHEHGPAAFSIFDVTEPSEPKMLWQLPLPHRRVRGNSLAMRGDILLMAYQAYDPGGKPAGFQVYDISKPAEPREITFYDLSGARRPLGRRALRVVHGRPLRAPLRIASGFRAEPQGRQPVLHDRGPRESVEADRGRALVAAGPAQGRQGAAAGAPRRALAPLRHAAAPHALLPRAAGPRLHRLHRRRHRDPRHRGQGASEADQPPRLPSAVPRLHAHRAAALRARPARRHRRGHRRPGRRLAEALLDRGRAAGNESRDDLEPADAAEFRRAAQGGRAHRRPQHPRERARAGQREAAEHGGLDVVQRGRCASTTSPTRTGRRRSRPSCRRRRRASAAAASATCSWTTGRSSTPPTARTAGSTCWSTWARSR